MSGIMRRLRHPVSVLLMSVLLATVLSPDFGWDAAGSRTAHSDHAGTAELEHPTAENDLDELGGDVAHDDRECAGHVLGHLGAALGRGRWPDAIVPESDAPATIGLAGAFLLSGKLEHPPTSASPA